MKTLIVYASKKGATKKCVELLKSKLNGEKTVFELDKHEALPIEDYDAVVIGGPVYMGQLDRSVVKFCETNAYGTYDAKIGLFVTAMTEDENYAEKFYSKELLGVASAVANFGGEINYDELGFMQKQIIKMVKKDPTMGLDDTRTIDETAISDFANKMNKAVEESGSEK